MKPAVVEAEAFADLESAFAWYERQRPGLGHDFLDEFRASVELIRERPQLLDRHTRRAPLRRVPFGVFYRDYSEHVVIVACLHGKVNPDRWRRRP